jgi:hypothetical protein
MMSQHELFPISGGCDTTLKAASETDLLKNLEAKAHTFDYDIMVQHFEAGS